MTLDEVLGLYNYWVVICLMMTGFYIVIARKNMIKTVIGLNIFQTSVVLLYITMGKVTGGTAPIIPPETFAHQNDHHGLVHETASDAVDEGTLETVDEGASEAIHQSAELIYSNPLPSVLMLTAIVVGIATTALALALIVRIGEDYGTVEEDEIQVIDRNERRNNEYHK